MLCLHGYMQSADILRHKMGSWRKGLRSRVELHFVDAPIVVKDAPTDVPELAERLDASDIQFRSWWNFTSGNRADRPGTNSRVVITGWPEARDAISDALRAAGPNCALMGFSQGATAAAAYAAEAGQSDTLPRPACVIAVSGFMPRDEKLSAAITSAGLQLPAMHVIGAADEIIPRARSDELAAISRAAVCVHVHPGGHFVPTCTGTFKHEIAGFLDGVVQRNGTGTQENDGDHATAARNDASATSQNPQAETTTMAADEQARSAL